ncbi:hypothetical protein [Desulfitibacter alkalitolerans]|uniref:hypothetical protein n=1 Tax=Desulfitibacter alkalitolerans TaxID=264641 RepID=UPI0012EC8F05|nr:hypothetical protein [Desulfitibacter alkalitolerans]
MRIRKNVQDCHEFYSVELQKRVADVFEYTSQIMEIRKLLAEIKREAESFRALFWSEQELQEKREAVSLFEARMKAAVYYTLRNIEAYQDHGWKELVREEEGKR